LRFTHIRIMVKHLVLTFSFAMGGTGARVSTGTVKEPQTIDGVPVMNNIADMDDFIVQFDEGTTEEAITKFCDGQCGPFGHPDHGGVAWASVRGREHLELLLKRRGGVKVQSVEADQLDYPFENEDEPSVQNTPWGITAVNAHQAPSDGRGAHIYVQDTGIRVSHRDFGRRAETSIDLTSGSLQECRRDPTDRCGQDRHGHGTHCAGSAAGTVYGVAKQARLYSVKTLSDQGPGARSWQYAAIDWVGQNGRRPAVLSMSLGGNGVSEQYRTVLRAATQAGVVVVVAAGNSNADACGFSPAFSPDVITVGSTTSTNTRSGFSNFGSCVDIMAPGSRIVSAGVSSNTAERTLSGTSMACPHVSGGAALILGRNPGTSVSSVRSGLHGRSDAVTGLIRDLRGSADRFLWVGRRRVPRR